MNRRKVLRDNIQGVTNGSIERLSKKAGVFRLSGLMYPEVRGIIRIFLEKLVKNAVIFAKHRRAKRVSEEDVRKALKLAGHEVAEADSTTRVRRALGLNSPARTVRTPLGKHFSSCGAKPYTGPRAKSPGRAPVRFKPGTQSRRQIKFYQKQSSCFSISKAAFERLVREVAQDFANDLQFSPEAFNLLQFATENHVISLLEDAVKVTLNAGRKTVFPKDIKLVRNVLLK